MAAGIAQARGELRGPCDREGWRRLGFEVDEYELQATEVNMSWGTAKEDYVIAAVISGLEGEFSRKGLVVQETGFTSCASVDDRCDMHFCSVQQLAQILFEPCRCVLLPPRLALH